MSLIQWNREHKIADWLKANTGVQEMSYTKEFEDFAEGLGYREDILRTLSAFVKLVREEAEKTEHPGYEPTPYRIGQALNSISERFKLE